MEQRTKEILNTIRKYIPSIFLAVYLAGWLSLVASLSGVFRGEELLADDLIFSPSKVTAYLIIAGNLTLILFTWAMVRLCFTPDATHRYRIFKLEERLEELNDRLIELESRSGCPEEKEKEICGAQCTETPKTDP